jgi:hypothetical protein
MPMEIDLPCKLIRNIRLIILSYQFKSYRECDWDIIFIIVSQQQVTSILLCRLLSFIAESSLARLWENRVIYASFANHPLEMRDILLFRLYYFSRHQDHNSSPSLGIDISFISALYYMKPMGSSRYNIE